MLKGFLLYYIFSLITGNPIMALFLVIFLYIIMDKAYFGFLPDLTGPFKRGSRIRHLTRELEINPANADYAQELGILYFEKKDYPKAIKFLEKAYSKVKNSARLYLYLGMAQTELNQLEKGKEFLLESLELDRKVGHGLPYIYLIRYELEHSGGPAGSTVEWEEGLGRFPSTENYFRAGLVYEKQGFKKKAGKMYEKALDEYAYVPKRLRRLHRKWAILSRVHRLFIS